MTDDTDRPMRVPGGVQVCGMVNTLERQPSPREIIDWLAFTVAQHCPTQRDTRMYMAVRDALVQYWGGRWP